MTFIDLLLEDIDPLVMTLMWIAEHKRRNPEAWKL